MTDLRPAVPRRTITLERFFEAPVETVWELWTTKPGIESWWGPPGFSTTVSEIEVRPGGRIVYLMSASEPGTREFLERQGMPLATEQILTIGEVVPCHRLTTVSVVDFVPGVPAYKVAMTVVMEPVGATTRLLVTLDAMHDEHWTDLAVRGWEAQLANLAREVARPVR